MIDSLYYMTNIACVIYLFRWAVKRDDSEKGD